MQKANTGQGILADASMTLLSPLTRILLLACAVMCSCRKEASREMPHRAYVWQRQWTPAVTKAALTADSSPLRGLALFGAEIVWDKKGASITPRIVFGSPDWKGIRSLRKPVAIVMRIANHAGPFAEGDEKTAFIAAQAAELLRRVRGEGVSCAEFQLDFDCGQKKLAGYAHWLRAVRRSIAPTRLVITTLPSWLAETDFPRLVTHVDAYVLQVHSVTPSRVTSRSLLCEPDRARKWVQQAAKLQRPFEIALSTYSALAGYDPQGQLLGLALDATQPRWPAGTQVMRLDSDAPALAALVQEWTAAPPQNCTGIIWYRLPVETDQRNWHWSTLAAILDRRMPQSRLEAKITSTQPYDISLENTGEVDEDLRCTLTVNWANAVPPAAIEALPGWQVRQEAGRAIFSPPAHIRLAPGGRVAVGWLCFQESTPLHVEVTR